MYPIRVCWNMHENYALSSNAITSQLNSRLRAYNNELDRCSIVVESFLMETQDRLVYTSEVIEWHC